MGNSADISSAGEPGRGLLFEALRACTRSEHDEIESLLRLTEPMTLARYTTIVAGFHAFLRGWEPRLQAALPVHLHDWSQERRRADFAEADLRFFGLVPLPASVPAESVAERVLGSVAMDSPAQALGSMYVIEGSALGGQVITPSLAATLNLAPDRGARYFHGFGNATGAMWREFRQRLEAEIGPSAAAIETACESARATFRALIKLFRALPA